MRRTAGAGTVIAVLAAGAIARADAIGPMPTRDDCARGSVSTVANMMSHGQHAYCAPSVCAEGAGCREGFRCVIAELEIREHVVTPSSGHGASPAEPPPSTSLAEVAGPCDADDAAPVTSPAASASGFLLSGPTTEQVPVGCHRLAVWVADEAAHCRPGDRVAAPVPEVRVQAPASAGGRPAIVAAPATREEAARAAAARPADPAIDEPPAPVATTHQPAPRDEGCGCAVGRRRAGAWALALALMALALARRSIT